MDEVLRLLCIERNVANGLVANRSLRSVFMVGEIILLRHTAAQNVFVDDGAGRFRARTRLGLF